jgi:hypothetical protein
LGLGARARGHARAPPNDGVVDARFDERFLAFALDRSTDTIGLGRVEVGHVVGHVESHGANLRHEILGRHAEFLGQLVHAYLSARAARAGTVGARISSIKSASNHRESPCALIDRPDATCIWAKRVSSLGISTCRRKARPMALAAAGKQRA